MAMLQAPRSWVGQQHRPLAGCGGSWRCKHSWRPFTAAAPQQRAGRQGRPAAPQVAAAFKVCFWACHSFTQSGQQLHYPLLPPLTNCETLCAWQGFGAPPPASKPSESKACPCGSGLQYEVRHTCHRHTCQARAISSTCCCQAQPLSPPARLLASPARPPARPYVLPPSHLPARLLARTRAAEVLQGVPRRHAT